MKVAYSTRNLDAELRDRLRVLATLKVHGLGEMEDVLNEALAIGLAVLEKEIMLAMGDRNQRRTKPMKTLVIAGLLALLPLSAAAMGSKHKGGENAQGREHANYHATELHPYAGADAPLAHSVTVSEPGAFVLAALGLGGLCWWYVAKIERKRRG